MLSLILGDFFFSSERVQVGLLIVDVILLSFRGRVEFLNLVFDARNGVVDLRHHSVPCSVDPLNILSQNVEISLYVKEADEFGLKRWTAIAKPKSL